MKMLDIIKNKLLAALPDAHIDIEDQSARHAGHAGAPAGGESHFALQIISAAFIGQSRLERQRLIHQVLAEEMRHKIHALSLRLHAPDEKNS